MSFPTITAAGQTHTLANGVVYYVTPNLAWAILSYPSTIALLSELTLPGSGFVGDIVPAPRAYIDDGATPDVLMIRDNGTGKYVPSGSLVKSQLDTLNATASGETYPTTGGVPPYYVDDTVSPSVLQVWSGTAYADAGGGADGLGGTVAPTSIDIQSGAAFSETFTSSSGVAPFTWSLSSGALPAGLSLNSTTGALTGTPTDGPGTAYNFTLRATDTNGDYNDGVYSGTVAGASLGGVVTPTPASVTLTPNVTVSENFASSNGVGPFTWSVIGGALPTGVSLNPTTGALSGAPTDADGTAYSFTVRAVDTNGDYNEETYAGNLGSAIGGGSIAPSSVHVREGGTVNTTLSGNGGAAPYEFSLFAGTLPVGLTLDQNTGVISGTATGTEGDAYNFTIRASDAAGNYVDGTYSGVIQAASPVGPVDPTTLTLTSITATNTVSTNATRANGALIGNILYATTRIGSTRVIDAFDVTNPASPTEVTDVFDYATNGQLHSITTNPSGTKALTVEYTGGLGSVPKVWDTSSPLAPVEIAMGLTELTSDNNVSQIRSWTVHWFSDDIVMYPKLGTSPIEFLTYDLSTPGAPVLLNTFTNWTSSSRVDDIPGTPYIFEGRSTVMNIWDFSDPAAPAIIGSVPTGGIIANGPTGYDASTGILYVGNASEHIWALDISDPTTPVILDESTSGLVDDIQGVVYNNGHVYVATGQASNRLYVFDVSDPSNIGGNIESIAGIGGTGNQAGHDAFFTDFQNGLLRVDNAGIHFIS